MCGWPFLSVTEGDLKGTEPWHQALGILVWKGGCACSSGACFLIFPAGFWKPLPTRILKETELVTGETMETRPPFLQ